MTSTSALKKRHNFDTQHLETNRNKEFYQNQVAILGMTSKRNIKGCNWKRTSNFFFIGQKICSPPLIGKFRCLSCEGISSKTHNFFIFRNLLKVLLAFQNQPQKSPKSEIFCPKLVEFSFLKQIL